MPLSGNPVLSSIGIRAVFTGTQQLQQGMHMIRQQSAMATTSLNTLSRSANQSNTALIGFGQTIANAGNSVRQFGSLISNVGLRMSALITAPVLFAGYAITETGTRFEEELVKIINLADVAEGQVRAWGDSILDMSANLGVVPDELARGLFFVASSGIRDASQAMDIMETAAKGAAIGLGETNEVAKTLTAAVLTFGITSEEAADTLIQAVREGQGETDELASTLGRVLGIASAVGASFSDVTANVATFTQVGVPAEVAVTSLRTALTNIIKPTAAAKEALAEAGLSATYLMEQIGERGLARTLVELINRLQETGGLEAITDVFGSARAIAGVLSVARDRPDEYIAIADRVANANGALAESFERVKDSPLFIFRQLVASLDVLKIQLAQAILPLVITATKEITQFVQSLSRFAEANPMIIQLGFAFGVLAAAIGPVLFLGGAIVSTFGIMIGTVGFLIAALGSTVTIVGGALTGAFLAASAVLGSFATAVALTARDIEQKMGPAFDRLIGRAKAWGANLIVSFVEGMIEAFTFVVRGLTRLGELIAYWLRPGSPPRILPELNVWGREAMNEYLQGWTEADFSIFNDLRRTISSFVESLGEVAGLEDEDIAAQVLATTEDLIGAMEIWRQTGEITDEVLNRVTDTISEGQQEVSNYVQSMFSLQAATQAATAAQEELNAVNQHYDDILLPLNSRLDELNAMRTEWQRINEQEQLEAILDDPRASDEARRRARLMLERLDILREIDRVEAQREDAVSPIERQLEAAQRQQEVLERQVAAQEELIRLQTDLNQLIADTMAESAGGDGIADPFADVDDDPFGLKALLEGEGLPEGHPLTGPFDTLREESTNVLTPINNFIDTIKNDLAPALTDASTALDGFSTAWADVGTILADFDISELNLQERGGEIVGELVRGMIDEANKPENDIMPIILEEFFGNPDDWRFEPGEDVSIESIFDKLGGGAGGDSDRFARGFMMGLTGYPTVRDWFDAGPGPELAKIPGWIAEAITTPRPLAPEFIDSQLGADIIGVFAGTRYAFNLLVDAFSEGSPAITGFQITWEKLATRLEELSIAGIFQSIWDAIARPRDIPPEFAQSPLGRYILGVFEVFNFENFIKLPGELQRVWGRVPQVLDEIWKDSWETVTGWVEDLVGDVVAYFEDLYTDLVGASIVVDLVDEIVRLFTTLPERILRGLIDFVTRVSQPFVDLKNNLVGPNGVIPTAVDGIIAIVTGIPDLLAAIPFEWDGIISIFTDLGTTLAESILTSFMDFPLFGLLDEFLGGALSDLLPSIDSSDFTSSGSIGGQSGLPSFFPDQNQNSILPGPLEPIPLSLMGGERGNQVTVDMGGQNIYNGLDIATLRTIIRQEVTRAINL